MTSRIFLDASGLFAATYSPTGGARELLRLGLEGQVALITNRTAIEEAERNLQRKLPEGVAIFRTGRHPQPHPLVVRRTHRSYDSLSGVGCTFFVFISA